jgi:tRNA threonylcarbamoyladenosine biosynthesis protein TsaB
MLLAIDTATRVMSIALHSGQRLLSEQSWHTQRRHTADLAPAVQAMMAACEVYMDELTGLAVAHGPGSYTGLRIGVAMAKGLAAARDLPLVGVSTLDILAAGQPYYQSGTGLVAVVQAGRGRITVNSYRWRKGRWSSHSEPRIMDWETLLGSVDGPAHITGEIDAVGAEAIEAARSNGVPVTAAPPAHRLRRAGFLAETALERLRENPDGYTAGQLLPVYIKSDD